MMPYIYIQFVLQIPERMVKKSIDAIYITIILRENVFQNISKKIYDLDNVLYVF